MGRVLVLDVGGSGVRTVATGRLGRPRSLDGRASPVRGAAVDLDLLASLVSSELARLGPGDKPVEVGLSTAGYHKTGVAPDKFHEAIRVNPSITRTVVASDAVAGLAGTLGPGSGAVISAGTGAVAIGRDDTGEWRLADGWGYMVGDEGSGFWVGRQGLVAALRHFDGRRGGSEGLYRMATESFADLADLPGILARDPNRVATVSAFAEKVVLASEGGDPVAAGILDRAAEALADALTAVLPGGGAASYAGGLLTKTGAVLDRLRSSPALAGFTFRDPAGDALSGMVRLMDEPTRQLSEWLGALGSVREYG